MDEESSQPLLAQESVEVKLYPKVLPPAYEPHYEHLTKPIVLMSEATPIKDDVAIPLPTYEQSEKFEKDGVFDSDAPHPDGSIRFVSSRQQYNGTPGSSCEFIIFFMVCFFFSWLGYLISCCMATTLAAQSGAAAGFGLSLVFKTIFIEFQPHYLTDAVHSLCTDNDYFLYNEHSDEWTRCTRRYYSFLRLFFWILGFLGLFMFARGISVFCQSRPRPRNEEDNNNA